MEAAPLDLTLARFDLPAVYRFGSQADDGLRLLAGEAVEREGSDLDVGTIREPACRKKRQATP